MAYDKLWMDLPGLGRQDGGCAHVGGVKTALGAATGGRQRNSQTLGRGQMCLSNIYLADVEPLWNPATGQQSPCTNFKVRRAYLHCEEHPE